MVDSLGQYSPRWKKKLSKKEVAELRQNMKKVPKIQEKSDEFHLEQSKQAEQELSEKLVDNTEWANDMSQLIPETKNEKSTLWSQMRVRIVDKFS